MSINYSCQLPMGVLCKNENLTEDMIDILRHFQTYLPTVTIQGEKKFASQICTGDQLSVERAVNAIHSVSNGHTAEDHLEGFTMQLGDWHTGVKILELLFRRFYSGSSSGDHCTLFADRNLINRRNVREDPHSAYRPDRDFLILEVKARILAAAFHVLGLKSKDEKPRHYPFPEDLPNWNKLQRLQFFHKAAGMIVDEIVIDEVMVNGSLQELVSDEERREIQRCLDVNEDGRFPCRFPGCTTSFKYNGKSRRRHELSHDPPVVIEGVTTTTSSTTTDQASKSSDDVFNYNAALLSEGLFFMNVLDAVSEGDGQRIMRQYKYLMLLCKVDDPHSTKYALGSLYQLLLVNGLSQKESEIFVWNRTVNNHRGLGNNITHDLEVEHSNNFNKQGYWNIGANLSEKAVSRICHAEKPVRNISGKVDRLLQRIIRSGKHIQRFPVVDL
ncbi:uncharacterized protein [Montipora capricornis]|uniref:uncharacterized protein n=1 Tax=Montipora capricornis TaxID=246305 RepID=UPI0035F201CF